MFFFQPDRAMYVDPNKIIPKPKQIELRNKANEKLVGWFFQSEKEVPKSPIILFFHGNAQNISSHFTSLYWILDRGYSFIIFDYPGYGGSEGETTQENAVEAGELYIEKIKHDFPERPIVIFGQSLGGQIAMKVTLNKKNDSPISLVVVESTFAKYTKMAQEVVTRHWWTAWLYPLAPILVSDKYSPNEQIADISPIPLIVVHGDADETVEYEMGKMVYDYAKEPKEFWTVPGGKHIDSFTRKDSEEMRNRLIHALETKGQIKSN